ncbi:MAG: polyphosphate kinase 1, partial [Bacteroidota bacterium]
MESTFVEKLRQTLQIRNRGSVVRIELEADYDQWLLEQLQEGTELDNNSLFLVPLQSLMDFTGLSYLIRYKGFEERLAAPGSHTLPLTKSPVDRSNLLETLKEQDILLHHPYNSFDWVLDLLNQAAVDPYVSVIKMTIYRLASPSAVVIALCKAARQGKSVLVVIEAKARFDEENNLHTARELEQAGCHIIYGASSVKVHAKAFIIVRQESQQTTRYVHLSSGNYNEETAQNYADVGLLTTKEHYANDVAEFFNAITGHSFSKNYEHLLTKPCNLREELIALVRQEVVNAKQGLPCGIVIKVNALEDKAIIEVLYQAAHAGVPIRLIVRSICCLVPGRSGLSENIAVRSITGRYLEHARLFYFHNQGNPRVYVGSADMMLRSFEKRVEILFAIVDPFLKQQVIGLLDYNLRDNVNAYLMREDGMYVKQSPGDQIPFDIHQAFFQPTPTTIQRKQILF